MRPTGVCAGGESICKNGRGEQDASRLQQCTTRENMRNGTQTHQAPSARDGIVEPHLVIQGSGILAAKDVVRAVQDVERGSKRAVPRRPQEATRRRQHPPSITSFAVAPQVVVQRAGSRGARRSSIHDETIADWVEIDSRAIPLRRQARAVKLQSGWRWKAARDKRGCDGRRGSGRIRRNRTGETPWTYTDQRPC